MIRQLQKRFIRIAVISLTMAMILVVAIVNIANWISVRNELFGTLNLLGENESEMEKIAESEEERHDQSESENGRKSPFPRPSRHFRNMMAESNWFSAMVSETGEVERVMLARIENLEEETARELIRQIVADGRTEGFLQDYLFRITTWRNGNREVMVLNCETRLATVRTLILISAIACAGGILLALMLVMLSSRKAIQPTIRNMEQQKQFITNASHELKTPLTVISTNMELLEMENEGNPWVRSTQNQAAAMRRLVDELVYLSRMEEEYPTLEFETLDLGELLKETAEPFAAMAEYNGLEMTVTAEKNLQMNGDRASIQRLISTLCDNAVKYSKADTNIFLSCRREENGTCSLNVRDEGQGISAEDLPKIFDRFYRSDKARKSETGGHGLGLSIARIIVIAHNGKIRVRSKPGAGTVFSVILPVE